MCLTLIRENPPVVGRSDSLMRIPHTRPRLSDYKSVCATNEIQMGSREGIYHDRSGPEGTYGANG
jgi:hypothetical protein